MFWKSLQLILPYSVNMDDYWLYLDIKTAYLCHVTASKNQFYTWAKVSLHCNLRKYKGCMSMTFFGTPCIYYILTNVLTIWVLDVRCFFTAWKTSTDCSIFNLSNTMKIVQNIPVTPIPSLKWQMVITIFIWCAKNEVNQPCSARLYQEKKSQKNSYDICTQQVLGFEANKVQCFL